MEDMKSTSSAREIAPVKSEMDVADSLQEQLAINPSIEQIRQRAYELYLERERLDGNDLDDWLQAERELVDRIRNRHSL
jgi:hypothetical protein